MRIEHVDSSGVGDSPEVGVTMSVHVFVSLGDLAPDDVEVQLLHGRVREEDDLKDVSVVTLPFAESFEAGRHRYEGEVTLAVPGAFGYTLRVVPRHSRLAGVAEMGLVALP